MRIVWHKKREMYAFPGVFRDLFYGNSGIIWFVFFVIFKAGPI